MTESTNLDWHQSDGLNKSEQHLAKLCSETFLRLWHYPNLYTDKGVTKHDHQGKELCDLLVVFDNHILIFSDKNCDINDTEDAAKDWCRWYRKAIKKSADQVFGAERWIKKYPDRIFMDKQCQVPFPLNIPPIEECVIHRIVVASGAKNRAEKYFGGGSSGSLMQLSWLNGDEHLNPATENWYPFAVGQVAPEKGFVHVFDEANIDILLSELDTITDFVEYLVAKEGLFKSLPMVSAGSEEDLLGFYLLNGGSFEEGYDRKGFGHVHIPEGEWLAYYNSDVRRHWQAKISASAYFDSLLDIVSEHIVTGTLLQENDRGIAYHERNIRLLAAEPRHHRVMLTEAFLKKIETTPANVRSGFMFPSSNPAVLYVYLCFPLDNYTREIYRQERQACLTAYCHVAKHLNSHADYIVGIATESSRDSGLRSEDIISFDMRAWTEEDDANAKIIMDEYKIFTHHAANSIFTS
ncbi:zinc chelation protein SecC [Terasakiella brassicae]|uniref:Zinc chelation protein SecC n=1 Tax=Terasakiella brassicae TaxID=1634917 RepID=A0A917FFM2_9PROT|nr:hypothetical protein [Terasakiella brassicae]GGF74463.1 zinc chelation protein SecC [Terasakiella brassicae]